MGFFCVSDADTQVLLGSALRVRATVSPAEPCGETLNLDMTLCPDGSETNCVHMVGIRG